MKKRLFACILAMLAFCAFFAAADVPYKVNGRDLSDLSVEELYDLEDAIVDSLHVAFERKLASSTKDAPSSVYVVNPRSKKFHYPYCYSALEIGPDRQFIESSPSGLVEMGYKPCGQCNPGSAN